MISGIRLLIVAALVFGGYFVRYSVKRDNRRTILIALLFGTGAAITAVVLNTILMHALHLPDPIRSKVHASVHQLATLAGVVAIIEETVKFVPLALLLLRRKYFQMISDGVLYFGLAGLMFGSIEHLMYGASFGEGTLLVRIFLVLFLHAGLTGMVGYFYAKDRLLGNRFRTVLAFITAVGLHFVYDFSLFLANRHVPMLERVGFILFSGLIAAGLNCLLVWLFYLASRRDWQQVQRRAAG